MHLLRYSREMESQVWKLELKDSDGLKITLSLLTQVEGDGFHSNREHIKDGELSQTCSDVQMEVSSMQH